ncbi:MAG: hotdog fold thioesterase [Candidatus Omnitrophica bacterium]|nr:hotdog fold thioesterase [Candidatus Omnitrophota bacterium]
MESNVLNDKFAKHLGAQIVEVAAGYAKTKLVIQSDFLNGLDVAHGGVIFSLVDYAFALASNVKEESGLAINANIHFIKSVALHEEIIAEVKEVSRSRKLGSYQGVVTNKNGDIIAQFQAMAYLKKTQE